MHKYAIPRYNRHMDAIKTKKPFSTAPTGKAAAIRVLHDRYPEMSQAAIARKVGCTDRNVSVVLKNYLRDTSPEELSQFQDSKADIYDAIQNRILASITPEKIEKAKLVESITSAAILEDKARLVRGQATGINVSVLMDVVEAIRARQK